MLATLWAAGARPLACCRTLDQRERVAWCPDLDHQTWAKLFVRISSTTTNDELDRLLLLLFLLLLLLSLSLPKTRLGAEMSPRDSVSAPARFLGPLN